MISDKIRFRISIPIASYVFLLGLFFFLVTPGQDVLNTIESLYDKKRAAQLLLLALSCFTILISHGIRETIQHIISSAPAYVKVSIGAIIIVSIISASISPAPEYALEETLTFFALGLLSLTIAAITILDRQLMTNIVIWSLFSFAGIYELKFLISTIAALIVDGKLVINAIFSGFVHHRFFNQYQVWFFAILPLPLLIRPELPRYIKISIFVITSLWITLLLASSGRGATLAYLASLTLTVLVFKSKAFPIFKLQMQCLVIGIGIYILLFIIVPHMPYFSLYEQDVNGLYGQDIQRITSLYSSQQRILLWSRAFDYIQKSPWFGIGPMHFAYYLTPIASHPHNSILQIASEFGVPVALTAISLICLFLYKWVIQFRQVTTDQENQSSNNIIIIWISLFFSLLSGLLYSLISGIIVMPMSQSMMAIIFGLMIGLFYQTRPDAEISMASPKDNSRFITIMLISGAILISLTYLVTPQLTTKILTPFRFHYASHLTKGPRFWQAGAIDQKPVDIMTLY